MSKKTGRNVKCELCGKDHYRAAWELKIKGRYYCSKDCANSGHSKLLTKNSYNEVKCLECGKQFQQHWKGPKKFCSVRCSSKHNLSIINSKTPKKKGTKPEKLFANILESNNIEYIFQYYVPWKKGWKKWYDFYIPEYNLLVEVDGVYWHGKGLSTSQLNNQQWNTRKNDRFKNYLAKKNGYRLIRVWSDELSVVTINMLKNISNEF